MQSNVTNMVLALLYEVREKGTTAHEASGRLDCKYNSAGIALARLHAEGWTRRDKESSPSPGRKRMRYWLKEGT